MTANHRLRIATISVLCLLLVAPATVPADGIEPGPTAVSIEPAPAPAPAPVPTPAPVSDPVPAPDTDAVSEPATDVARPPAPAGDANADETETEDVPEVPSPEAGPTGPIGGGPTGPTGGTGPTGPEPGGVGEEPNPGTDPANPTPAPESGAPAPPATPAPDGDTPAPEDEGTGTDESPNRSERDASAEPQLVAPGNGTIASQVANTLAAVTVPEEAVRERAVRAAERTQVGAETLVVTRIVENVPDWVGFAMVALGLFALLSLGVFWRERRRRHSAEFDAMVDSLTGIPNRKAFDRRLDLEWRRAERYGRSLGLMVMDLDGFKAINDVKGHAAGDQVLRAVAQKLDGRMRDTDLVARIGGDEFAVICPETGINELMTIRGQLAEQATRGVGETVGLSIGVAEYVPGDQDSASILARADESMYRVKRGERTESVAHAAHT